MIFNVKLKYEKKSLPRNFTIKMIYIDTSIIFIYAIFLPTVFERKNKSFESLHDNCKVSNYPLYICCRGN